MKLLTAAIIKKLDKTPLYSTENRNVVPVLVKFFAPWNGYTYYVIEAEKIVEDNRTDYRFFGLVTGLQEDELGYTMLSELQGIRGRFGLKIERDMYFDNMMLNKQTHELTKVVPG